MHMDQSHIASYLKRWNTFISLNVSDYWWRTTMEISRCGFQHRNSPQIGMHLKWELLLAAPSQWSGSSLLWKWFWCLPILKKNMPSCSLPWKRLWMMWHCWRRTQKIWMMCWNDWMDWWHGQGWSLKPRNPGVLHLEVESKYSDVSRLEVTAYQQ